MVLNILLLCILISLIILIIIIVKRLNKKNTTSVDVSSDSVLDPFNDKVLSLVSFYGVNVMIRLHAGLLKARLSAYDLIKDTQGGVGEISYGISKDGSTPSAYSTNPKNVFVDFGCQDIGMNIVTVWVKDSNNISGIKFESSVSVQNSNDPLC